MSHDVLHHHNGVIHQNADGENEGEESDAVKGVAVEIERPAALERQRGWDRDGHDAGLAPAQRQQNRAMETPTTAMPMWKRSSFDFSAAVSP